MSIDCGITLFAIGGTHDYGKRVAQHLDLIPGAHDECAFEDVSTRSVRSSRCAVKTSS
jgi:hypothetical protein